MRGKLTPKQARWHSDAAGQRMRFFARVQERMQKLGFAEDDRLYRAVVEAHNAAHLVRVHAHYASCGHGVAAEFELPSYPRLSR